MLYPKKMEKLTEELFKDPPSEYRGAPFWAWNSKLNPNELSEQIGAFKLMGMGGFHIHSRTGLAVNYLSNEFMNLVNFCNEKAKKEKMLCWLYDEDRWPSGFAGGYVTKDDGYRQRFLVFTPFEYDDLEKTVTHPTALGDKIEGKKRKLLGKYEISLKNGYLVHYKRLKDNGKVRNGSDVWWAYLEIATDDPWFNNQSYVNTLDKHAILRFLDITHEKYYKELGKDFGKSIPAIFTDEPQFAKKSCLPFSDEKKEVILPFTDDLEESYYNTYNESLIDHLPELIWELPNDQVSVVRYRYHDHLTERFVSAFADTIGNWCEKHEIMLTGHLMEEPTLESQTAAVGEAMRSYRSFQLPGIDMLCDWREFSTAKQAQSAAHQYGREGVLSEIYGVTNWDFDFRGYKLAGDWQAALGVTVRVHHLTWYSMEGEAKRDYPPSIGYQIPWYKEYSLIENHFSRLNTVLTRGKPVVRVGVIHPIESYWLHWGPKDKTATKREELETNFKNIIEWLLFGLIDFDFISESLLPSLSEVQEKDTFQVGKMNYEVIIVPGCETLRKTTLERLYMFQKSGGKIIFLSEPPKFVDAFETDRVKELAKKSLIIPFSKSALLQELKQYKDIEIFKEDGMPSDNLFLQLRCEEDKRCLFISHVYKMKNSDIAQKEKISIIIKGIWDPVIYDTVNAETKQCEAEIKNGTTMIKHDFYPHDSLLLELKPFQPRKKEQKKNTLSPMKEIQIEEPVFYSLSEPNVVVLDMAEYSFDNGEWQSKEEILRIDNKVRELLGYPFRKKKVAQPWTNKEEEPYEHLLKLKYTIESKIEVNDPLLALENPENTKIIVNGKKVESKLSGWFVDKCIKKVQIPNLPKGFSEIILEIPFISKTNIEWNYLLGDFGVEVRGKHVKIVEPKKELSFGDWANQGLPFYAGNITYHCTIECEEEGFAELEVPHFRTALLSVSVDGYEKGKIAFAPYTLALGKLSKGKHTIDITAYGNRINAFGTIHNCDETYSWFDPDAWRTTGNQWSYEYRLKPMGILISPKLIIKTSKD
ncbi:MULTISPECIES: hypothetical protein [Petrotoga]|uniref:Alpha-L-rhamnosidase-like protein n=2 Tax=Petrotoga sibirica TaxID=156202 RepID=A0A4R8EZL4_9BACT|nr:MULTISPECIES: hypothetical protein [Petrotoga]POZ89399.1 hypothetical protein AA80_00610 [Petrotoga sibirica DSM 13575]POZ91923.1 hypothetical protein AD60_00610 [Petrotoga sp. SL27]TDX16295.1 hypothetical protein C8D74_104114 [Petrotoga sibirica]